MAVAFLTPHRLYLDTFAQHWFQQHTLMEEGEVLKAQPSLWGGEKEKNLGFWVVVVFYFLQLNSHWQGTHTPVNKPN